MSPNPLPFSSVKPGSDRNALNFMRTHAKTYPTIDPTQFDLSGKYVVITGASKGVGRATALSYAKAGVAGLALMARSSLVSLGEEIALVAEQANRACPKLLLLTVDISRPEDILAAAKEVASTFGHLDILINNAAHLAEWVPIGDSDPMQWWYTWEVNIRGTYVTTRELLPLLLKGSEKTIINLTSIGANLLNLGGSAYETTKFALVRFSEFISSDYHDQGVISYAVHPCAARTELACAMPEYVHSVLVEDAEVAGDTLVFLTSERREWLAGRYISCPWDMDELLSRKDEIIAGDLLKYRLALDN